MQDDKLWSGIKFLLFCITFHPLFCQLILNHEEYVHPPIVKVSWPVLVFMGKISLGDLIHGQYLLYVLVIRLETFKPHSACLCARIPSLKYSDLFFSVRVTKKRMYIVVLYQLTVSFSGWSNIIKCLWSNSLFKDWFHTQSHWTQLLLYGQFLSSFNFVNIMVTLIYRREYESFLFFKILMKNVDFLAWTFLT